MVAAVRSCEVCVDGLEINLPLLEASFWPSLRHTLSSSVNGETLGVCVCVCMCSHIIDLSTIQQRVRLQKLHNQNRVAYHPAIDSRTSSFTALLTSALCLPGEILCVCVCVCECVSTYWILFE